MARWCIGQGYLAPPDDYQYEALIERSGWALGGTVGADVIVSLRPALRVVAPVRFTYVPDRRDRRSWWVTSHDFHAGVGLRVTALRSAR